MVKILAFYCLIFCSCATITTKKNYDTYLCSNETHAEAIINDSSYRMPALVKLKRSNRELNIQLITKDSVENFIVKPSPTKRFLYANALWLDFAPFAYLIDFTNKKRFTYGETIFLNTADSSRVIRPPLSKGYYDFFNKEFPNYHNKINFTVSVPWVNAFLLSPAGMNKKRSVGFLGVSEGFEWFYTSSKFFAFKAFLAFDYPSPIPVPIEYIESSELMNSFCLSLTDNIQLKRFIIGYGPTFVSNTWKLRKYPFRNKDDEIKKTNNSFGFSFNSYMQLQKNLFMGINYNNALLNIYPKNKLFYEHQISLDFIAKISLKGIPNNGRNK